jgi:hypothetical protein
MQACTAFYDAAQISNACLLVCDVQSAPGPRLGERSLYSAFGLGGELGNIMDDNFQIFERPATDLFCCIIRFSRFMFYCRRAPFFCLLELIRRALLRPGLLGGGCVRMRRGSRECFSGTDQHEQCKYPQTKDARTLHFLSP